MVVQRDFPLRNLRTDPSGEYPSIEDILNGNANYYENIDHGVVADLHLNDDELHVPVVNIEEERLASRRERNRQRRQQQQRKAILRPEPSFICLGLRGKSLKKHRRSENANNLAKENSHLRELDLNDAFDDVSIYDFVHESPSVFAQFMDEFKGTKEWKSFIDCTEDEQAKMFDEMKTSNKNEKSLEEAKSTLDEDEDLRTKHPAYTGRKSFDKLERHLKNALTKQSLPLGMLEGIENEIIEFFSTEPMATFKSHFPSSFQRLLLHACCQYMDLACSSFNKGGQRWTQVKNPRGEFKVPDPCLSSFMANNLGL